jgi:hypothetical protein
MYRWTKIILFVLFVLVAAMAFRNGTVNALNARPAVANLSAPVPPTPWKVQNLSAPVPPTPWN